MAIAKSVPAMALALAAAIGADCPGRASPGGFIRRLLPLEMLLVLVVVLVPGQPTTAKASGWRS